MNKLVLLGLLPLFGCGTKATDSTDTSPDDTHVELCTFYADQDGDSHGDAEAPLEAPCDDPPANAVAVGDDCDDTEVTVAPGADELCNERDDDCDGGIDEDAVDAVPSWPDADEDGWGSADRLIACDVPEGNVLQTGDCDDADPATNPDGVDEGCDGIDNDCDGGVDGGWRVPEDQPNLQVAVSSAPAGGLVCVSPGTHDGPLDTRGKAITVLGYGGADVTFVRGVGRARVVSITGGEGPDTVIQGLTILGGQADDGAGVYIVDSSPSLVDVVISGNSCVVTGTTGRCNGTGLYSEGGTPTLTRVTVRENTQEAALSFGAGVYISEGGAVLEDVVIEANSQIDGADRSYMTGAGGYGHHASLDLTGVVFRNNTQTYDRTTASEVASLYGAGLYVADSDLVAADLMVLDNLQACPTGYNCAMYGAGLYAAGVSAGSVSLTGAMIIGNSMTAATTASASGYGTGLCVQYADFVLTDSVIEDNHMVLSANSPLAFGAGMLLDHQDTELSHVGISGNTITSRDTVEGAGIQMESVTLRGTNVVLAGNKGSSAIGTTRGGAIYARETTIDLTNADIVGNGCPSGTCRGAAFNLYTTVDLTLRSVAMVDNGASGGSGGAVYSDYGNVTIDAAWSDFYLNGSSPFYGVTTPSAADANLFVDPLYTDTSATNAWDWDLSLAAGSPAIDAGDPAVLDADGSRADIGSRGGPGGSGW